MSKAHHTHVTGVDAVKEPPKVPGFKLSNQTFETSKDAKAWWKNPESVATEPHDVRFSIANYSVFHDDEGEPYIKHRGEPRRILTEAEARNGLAVASTNIVARTPSYPPAEVEKMAHSGGSGVARIMPVIAQDLQWGIASSARVMPVEVDAHRNLKYIVVYKPNAVYRSSKSGDSGSVVSE